MTRRQTEATPGAWDSWDGTEAGKAIKFIEKYLILPDLRIPMVLHPYQIDLIEQWTDPAIKAHATCIAAGNAKTTTLAAFTVAHLFLTDEADVPIIADTVQQAWSTTLGRAARFVETSPELECRAQVLRGKGNRSGVHVNYKASKAEAFADKPESLQGLMPSFTCLEEMSLASQDTFAALMARNKREGSKVIGISTPSMVPDNALLALQRRVQSGEQLQATALLEYVSPQKDHRDEGQWASANPAVAHGIKDVANIRGALEMMPEQAFRMYQLAQNPTGTDSCWLNSIDEDGDELGDAYECWMMGASSFRLEPGYPVWAGVDVAKSMDHAAVVLGQFRDDGRLHTTAKIWTPPVEGVIDLEAIADHLRWAQQTYDLREVWFDPSYFYNAPALDREGLPMVEVAPSTAQMAPLTLHAYEGVRRTRISHNDDEDYTRHVLNARRRYGATGFTLEKQKYLAKIDAAIALVLCYGAATQYATPAHAPDSFRIY